MGYFPAYPQHQCKFEGDGNCSNQENVENMTIFSSHHPRLFRGSGVVDERKKGVRPLTGEDSMEYGLNTVNEDE
jgi:hypothetical protein